MANRKITELATGTALANADLFIISDEVAVSAVSRSLRADALKTYIEDFAEIYAVTADETTAGITPTDKSYAPGNSLRYGDNVADTFNSGADLIVFEDKAYTNNANIVVSRSVIVLGFGAVISGTGSLTFDGAWSSAVTTVATQAEVGDQTVVLNAAGGIVADDIIRFRDTLDNSWAPYNTTDRAGEIRRVVSISGATPTLAGRIESQYPITTTEVDIITPIKVNISNLTVSTQDSGTNQPISFSYVADSKIEGVTAYGGELRAWEIESCFNIRIENSSGVCSAAAAGFQYGIAISQSQGVVVDGGYFYGTRHGATMGTSGKMPTRHCIVQNAELANNSTNSGGADFHAQVADSAYINCRIHNNAKLSGRNCKYINCHITANRNDSAMGYLNPAGGTSGYYGNTVDLGNGQSFAQIISDISAGTSNAQTDDSRLEFIGNDIEVNSNTTRIASHTFQPTGSPDIVYVHRDNTIHGDISNLASYMVGTFDESPSEVIIEGNRYDNTLTAIPQTGTIAGTAGSASTRWHIDQREGTWTPTLTTTGTDFDSVTYDAITTATWRRDGFQVHVEGAIRTDAVTVGSASGTVVIGGLPFTASAADKGALSIGYAANWASNRAPIHMHMRASTKTAYIYYRADVNENSALYVPADVGLTANDNVIYFSGSYVTSDVI